MGKRKQAGSGRDNWLGENEGAPKAVGHEHEVELSPEEKTERRMRAAADQERASWASGGNLINEGGLLVDLDSLTPKALKSKLKGHPEYEPGFRKDDAARKRLLAVIARKEAERDGPRADAEKRIAQMSAKEYVAHLCQDADGLLDAFDQGFNADVLRKVLERMNEEVALVKVGNAVRYMVNGIDGSGMRTYSFLKAADFHQLYANVLVPKAAVADLNNIQSKGAVERLSKVWDEWKDRRELEGFGFYPGSAKHEPQVPKGYLNLWTGLAVDPKKGDWSLFQKHLLEKVCGGNKEHYEFLMDWLAHAVQKPQEKPGSAVVIRSAQKGSGKSMLLRFLRKIFGRHLYSAARAEQLTGKFNGHLEETLIFGVEEGLWAGNHSNNSVLKDLITSEHISIERKGLDSKNAPNYTRFIFLSNEDWVVPAGTDERRYFVLSFEHDRAKDMSYFEPIFKQMEQEGGIEAMLHDLMERDIKANLRNPPVTEGLLKQRVYGLDGCERFLLDLATEGEVDAARYDMGIKLERHRSVTVPKSVVWRVAESFAAGKHEERGVQTRLGLKLKALGVEVLESRTASDRRSFKFPRLPEFQKRVAKLLGVNIDIQDDGLVEDEISGGLFDSKTKELAKVIGINQHAAKARSRGMQRGRLN